MIRTGDNRWEVLEKIGAYAAGELEGEGALEAERLIFENAEYRRLSESYARMLAMLSTLGAENVEVPQSVLDYAVRRAYVSAFFRQTETFLGGLSRSYVDAIVYYFGLRTPRESG